MCSSDLWSSVGAGPPRGNRDVERLRGVMASSSNWFRSGDSGRRPGRSRNALNHRVHHESLERRSLLSGVPVDASLLDSRAAETRTLDDGMSCVGNPGVSITAIPSHFAAVEGDTLSAAARQSLAAGIAAADAALNRVIASETFDEILVESFGRAVTDTAGFQAALASLRESLSSGGLVVTVEVLPTGSLDGHPGAYATAGADGAERIYLDAGWLSSTGDASAIAKVLLEEFGHAIDRRLNAAIDSPGDEGELFADRVEEAPLAAEELARILGEDDSGMVSIGGMTVPVEVAAEIGRAHV